MKKLLNKSLFNYLFCIIFLFSSLSVFAYEDCIISTDGSLTDIKIEHNNIIDVYPLVTITNDKDTIFVHALSEGETKFSVLKNKSERFIFNVKVSGDSVHIDEIDGFDIEKLDLPPEDNDFELDVPPILRGEM